MNPLPVPDTLPPFSVADFQSKGATLECTASEHSGPLALIELL
ncbi:MAG: hypothetical protein WCK08_07705 [Betaproteobacteria bacterium]